MWHLLRYLDDLEEWSHRVWSAAGIRRPWLPAVVRTELMEQWWAASRVPSAESLRGRIATFWVRVTPWLAWNPDVEELPDPPADPALSGAIVAALSAEVGRGGAPTVGRERIAAFEGAIRRLELLRAIRRSGRVVRPG